MEKIHAHCVFFELLIDYVVPTGTAVNWDFSIIYLESSSSSHLKETVRIVAGSIGYQRTESHKMKSCNWLIKNSTGMHKILWRYIGIINEEAHWCTSEEPDGRYTGY